MKAAANKNSLPARVEQWWGETDFRRMERITGFRQLDFDPDGGCQAFVDACNSYWEQLNTEEKIWIWKAYN